jgi:hypothetical protein
MAHYWHEVKQSDGTHRLSFAQVSQDLVALSADLRSFVKPLCFALPDGTPGPEQLPVFLRQQDEYCEWYAHRDANGRIDKITFSAEPPDYWSFLARKEPELVVELYKRHVDTSVTSDDLFFKSDVLCHGKDHNGQTGWKVLHGKGEYNELNKWTTTHGIMHLTHPANTLGAEVNLAARASLLYTADDEPPAPIFGGDASLSRIACAGYGGINRSSDPKIGATVGSAVAAGNLISLTDPVGLYIDTIDLTSLRGPDGRPVAGNVLKVVRGDPNPNAPRIVRAEVALPAGTNFGLEDCSFDGRPLKRAGQIAHQIGMVLYADIRNGATDQHREGCEKTFYCRRTPEHSEFFGGFDPDNGPANCGQLKDQDWIRSPRGCARAGSRGPSTRECRSFGRYTSGEAADDANIAAMDEPLLDAADIQGHLLTGFGGGYQILIGFKIRPDKLGTVRSGLTELVDTRVPSGQKGAALRALRRSMRAMSQSPALTSDLLTAVGVSASGITAFGGDPAHILDPFFADGPAKDAISLGDEVDQEGRPLSWLFGDRDETTPDVLVIFGSGDLQTVNDGAQGLLNQLGDTSVVYRGGAIPK